MKIRISNYSFNSATQQVTFNGYTQVSLDGVLLITNVTSNIIIYNFADPNLGGTISGNILTLDYNTSAMSNSDKLQIYYDDTDTAAKDTTIQILQDQNALLRKMVKLMESQATVDISNRQRVVVEGPLTASLTTAVGVSTVQSGLTAQIGSSYPDSINPYTLTSRAALVVSEFPVGQVWRVADSARNTFANSIRSNLT